MQCETEWGAKCLLKDSRFFHVRFEAQTIKWGWVWYSGAESPCHHFTCCVTSSQPSQPSPAQQPTKPGHSNLSCNLIFTRLHAHSFYALSIAWTNFQLFSSHQCSGQLTLNTVITHFQTSQSWQHFCHKTQNITMKLTLKSTSIWITRKMPHFQKEFLEYVFQSFWDFGLWFWTILCPAPLNGRVVKCPARGSALAAAARLVRTDK